MTSDEAAVWVAVVSSLAAVLVALITAVGSFVNSRRSGKKVDDIHHEMQPNHGKSVVDRMARTETQVQYMAGNVDRVAAVLTEMRLEFGEHVADFEKYRRAVDRLAEEQNKEIA